MSYNHLTDLPLSIINLKYLRILSLKSNYHLEKVTVVVKALANGKFSEKYIGRGVESSEAPVLAILEILSGEILKKLRKDKNINLYSDNRYKIDECGHITSIILPYQEGEQIIVFPH